RDVPAYAARPWALDLRSQLVQHVGVGLGVDLALEDLRGAGDREVADLLAQGILRLRHLALDLGAAGGDDARLLRLRIALGLLDDLAGLLVGRADNLLRLDAGGLEGLLAPGGSILQRLA